MMGRRGFFGRMLGGLVVAAGFAPVVPLSIHRGYLRTGGTLRDLVEYGQNFSASEYRNVFDGVGR